MVIAGERIYLRKMTVEDTDQVIRWRNAPHVKERFLFRTPLTKEMHLKWIEEKIGSGQVEQFVICEKERDRGIGSFYFRDIDKEHHTAELGIFIGEKDALGKGYGTEAVQLGVKYGFENMKLEKIMLRVINDNVAAIKNYEKNGFKIIEDRMETMLLDGVLKEIVFMERTKSGI